MCIRDRVVGAATAASTAAGIVTVVLVCCGGVSDSSELKVGRFTKKEFRGMAFSRNDSLLTLLDQFLPDTCSRFLTNKVNTKEVRFKKCVQRWLGCHLSLTL